MTASVHAPIPSHLHSVFNMEAEKWRHDHHQSVLHQKTPHRYQQSPVFTRKANGSSGGENHDHSRHRHHSGHHHVHSRPHNHNNNHHHHHRRRRGHSEGDKMNVPPEEKVHLLTELPWRNSGDFSETVIKADVSVPSIPRVNIPAVSPTLPRRYDNSTGMQRERTYSMPSEKRTIFARKGKMRAKSQDSSSPPTKRDLLSLPLELLQSGGYTGSVMFGIQAIAESTRGSTPETPDTPLADANGFLCVPDSVQRFLGFDVNHNDKGLSEEEIRNNSRLNCRRGSSSSESSTSTLT